MLEDFTRSVLKFAGISHPERIQLFAWYLHIYERRDRFGATDIDRCYDAVHLERPANVHASLRQLTERKPPVLLRDSGGYRLEGRPRHALDVLYGQPRDQFTVSKLVSDLTSLVPGAAETAFLKETVKCYSCGAFRAAIVMAWALAMDHVLKWILSDPGRLAAFNARIPIRFPNKKPVVVISTRIDFQDLKESEIIDVLASANLISSDVAKVLRQKLERRNSAAHPSEITFDQPQAEDVITDLINNVVLTLV